MTSTTFNVSSGVTSSGITLGSGQYMAVSSGGTAIDIVVNSGGRIEVDGQDFFHSGGLAIGAIINSGGWLDLDGSAIGTIINDGGHVWGGEGTLLDTVVNSGGTLDLLGIVTTGTVVEFGGFEFLSQGSIAKDSAISSGGIELLYSANVSSAPQIQSGGIVIAMPGAMVTSANVASGGLLLSSGVALFSAGILVLATSALSGAFLGLGWEAYALASGTVDYSTLSGGGLLLGSGAVASGLVISSGASLTVWGSAVNVTFEGGSETIESGGSAIGGLVEHGGILGVRGASIEDLTIGVGGIVSPMDSISSSFVVSGGQEDLIFGAISYSATLSAGGILDVEQQGSAQGTIIASGGVLYVSSGGVANDVTVENGGELVLLPGGMANSTIVESGGLVVSTGVDFYSGGSLVSAAQTISSAAVVSGAELLVLSGGSAVDALISWGGSLQVNSGGSVSGTVILQGANVANSGNAIGETLVNYGEEQLYGSGVDETLSAGRLEVVGATSGTLVLQYGVETVVGSATATQVASGGAQDVVGVANGTVISGGGEQTVGGSGSLVSGSVIENGGFLLISAHGTAIDPVVQSGGTVVVLSGGSISGQLVSSGGMVISSGTVILNAAGILVSAINGAASSAQVGSGAAYVLPGATAIATSVGAGGTIENYGTVSGTVMQGVELFDYGSAVGTKLLRGIVDVIRGAVDSGTVIAAGAEEFVGGTDVNATVAGDQLVFQYGTVQGATILSGGVEDIYTSGEVTDLTLSSGSQIIVEYLAYSSSGTVSLSPADVLTIVEGGARLDLQLVGQYDPGGFVLSAFNNGNGMSTAISYVPCYCRGTRVLTERGNVSVEDLAIGDRLITHRGETRPIHWIGRRAYDGAFIRGNRDVLPILIAQNALDKDIPSRDLYVSPLHAMFVDGALIPARALVNGGSISQLNEVAHVEYFHIELETHDVILAEGAAAESYLDDHNRGMFQNAAAYWANYSTRSQGAYCAPRLEDGALVSAVHARLAARSVGLGFREVTEIVVDLAVGVVSLMVPASIGRLRLMSPSAIGGADRRRLGALITGVQINGVALNLTDPLLARGFHHPEAQGDSLVRWTSGDAIIALPVRDGAIWCHIAVGMIQSSREDEQGRGKLHQAC